MGQLLVFLLTEGLFEGLRTITPLPGNGFRIGYFSNRSLGSWVGLLHLYPF